MLEKNLNELNIFALRDLARRTGVVSPTSKRKEELIKGIMEIISGEKEPIVAKSKQGRPPKVFGYNFANVMNFNSSNCAVDSLKQTFNQVKTEYESVDMQTVVGWIELLDNNSALLIVEKCCKNTSYFIPAELILGLKVRPADRIVAEVCMDENVKVVKKIFSINDCPILQMQEKRECFENVNHNLPTRKLQFVNEKYNALDLMIGENSYFYGSNNNDNTKTIIDLLNSCKVENRVYINISLADKNKIYLSNLNGVEKFVSNITDEIEFSRRIVSLAIERAKRLLEEGEDVVVFVDDISSITSVDKDGLHLVRNLVSITKEGNDKGSITLLAIMPNLNINQIEKLADRRLKIVSNNILNIE